MKGAVDYVNGDRRWYFRDYFIERDKNRCSTCGCRYGVFERGNDRHRFALLIWSGDLLRDAVAFLKTIGGDTKEGQP